MPGSLSKLNCKFIILCIIILEINIAVALHYAELHIPDPRSDTRHPVDLVSFIRYSSKGLITKYGHEHN